MTNHTPLPWITSNHKIVNKGLVSICDVHSKIDAKFIVTACNAHYELLEACKFALTQDQTRVVKEVLREAIAKAEGK